MIFFLSRATADKKASGLAVGESVWLMENGELTEYFVVQQGNPDRSVYTDSNVDGTWLMRKDVPDSSLVWPVWGSSYTKLASDLISYCESGNYLEWFPADVQDAMRTVVISRFNEGTKVFFPSINEVGVANSTDESLYATGSRLEYFKEDTNESRLALRNGTATEYFLRDWHATTIQGTTTSFYFIVDTSGEIVKMTNVLGGYGLRPMMILDPETKFSNHNEFVGL